MARRLCTLALKRRADGMLRAACRSKQVQKQIQQMKASAGIGKKEEVRVHAALNISTAGSWQQRLSRGVYHACLLCAQTNAEQKANAAAAAIDAMLFTEAKSKKELQREAEAKAAAALAKVAGEKKKEPDKRDIFVDTRDQKKEADGMEDWDDEKLKEVVSKKSGGQGLRCQTDIICKHFIDAVETRRYGWFWECPNGGDKCQYRHALPEGYVLKRDQASGPKGPDEGPRLEDIIEEIRKALTTRTPVTLERLIEWLEKK